MQKASLLKEVFAGPDPCQISAGLHFSCAAQIRKPDPEAFSLEQTLHSALQCPPTAGSGQTTLRRGTPVYVVALSVLHATWSPTYLAIVAGNFKRFHVFDGEDEADG